jgi:hypothetical protein
VTAVKSTHTNRLQVGGFTLDPEFISLELDENTVPYATLRATVPLDAATIDQLDPRTSPPPRVNVGMSQSFGYGRTLADVSADYAGMTLRELSVAPTILNADPSFEVGVGLWEASPDDTAATVIAHSDVQAHTGTHSMEVTGTGGLVAVWTTDMFPIETLVRWYRRAWIYPTTTITQAEIRVYWYDADQVEYTFSGSALNNPPVDTWTQLGRTSSQIVPNPTEAANYHFARLEVRLTGTDPHAFIDDVTMQYGRASLASLTTDYGTPFNPGGWRPSTRVRGRLYLADRQVDHATGTVQLTAYSDDGRLNEYALTSRTALTPSGSTVRDCCNLVLGHVLNTALPAGSTGAEVVETDALDWQPGETASSYIMGIIGLAGLRLWCDERGLWHLEDPELVEAPGQYVASPDVLADLTDAVSREDGGWADGAVVTYEWDDASTGDRRVAYDAAGVQGGRTIDRTVNRPYPGAGLARGMLRKAQALGRVLGLGGVADYSVRPYQAAQATLPDDSVHAGRVSAVTWSQPDDRMSVRTRDLLGITEHSWLFDPPGMSWDSIPPGTDWTED